MDKLVGLPYLLVGVGTSLDVALPLGCGGSRILRAGFGVSESAGFGSWGGQDSRLWVSGWS